MKKQLTFFVLLALLEAFVFSLVGCGDKCEGSKRTSAEFKVYNELYYYDKENGKAIEKIKQIEEDTLMSPSYVNFEAIDQNAISYEWTIGADPRKRTGRKVTVFFNDESVADESPITIKLKLKRNPDTKCFPDDKGIDSVTHRIYFLKSNQWPVIGKYSGSDDSNVFEKYIIEITSRGELKNLPKDCSVFSVGVGGTAFEFGIGSTDITGIDYINWPNCFFRQYDKKIGFLTPDRKTIVIDYSFTDKDQKDNSLKTRKFTGARIN
jgi:hypothetical protein